MEWIKKAVSFFKKENVPEDTKGTNVIRIDAEGNVKPSGGKAKNKRNIQNLAIILGIGIVMLWAGGFFSNDSIVKKEAPAKKQEVEKLSQSQGYLDEYDSLLENKIRNIMSQIQGVGKVSVAITYASSREIVPAQDTKQNESNTNERDKEGGVRNTSELDTDSKVVINQRNDTSPVVLKELPPEVQGVIVVAEGARNDLTKASISKAVSTALGISLTRVQVFPMANQ